MLFELDLSKPVKVPVGSNVALKIAKWLEPSLEYDLDGSMPFMNAPMVSTMSVLGVYEKEDFVERVLRKQKTVSEEEIKMVTRFTRLAD